MRGSFLKFSTPPERWEKRFERLVFPRSFFRFKVRWADQAGGRETIRAISSSYLITYIFVERYRRKDILYRQIDIAGVVHLK